MGQTYMRLPEDGDDRNASASRLPAPTSAHLATTTLQVGGMTCVANSYFRSFRSLKLTL
jgi:Cu+-exporting ATPase